MIIHGTKIRERKLGWVADFCPICRTIRAFQLIRVGLVSHIYFIGFGDGKLVEFQIECSECKTRLSTKEFRHAAAKKNNPFDLAALAAVTMPNLPELLADRLATEKQVRENPLQLPPDVRRALLQEPFSLLNPPLESRSESTRIDQPIVLGCLGASALLALGIVGLSHVPKEWDDSAGIVLMVVIGIGIVYTVVQLFQVNRRYFRMKTAPILVKALQPLKPTREELESIIGRCRELGLKIGKQTKMQELWNLLETQKES